MKRPENSGKPWTKRDLDRLERLAGGNTPTPLIAHNLGRSTPAIYQKARDEHISLKPTNQSPYNRQQR